MADPDIAIIGGGVGALTLGVALAQRGLSFRIFERRTALWRGGGGLKLWPNAMRAYRHLGLDADVASYGSAIRTGFVQTAGGRVVSRMNLGRIEAALGLPIASLPRERLVDRLAAELPEGAVTLGKGFVGFELTDAGVTARFADGTATTSRVLIGVDGAESGLRAQLFGEGPLEFHGRISWRGTVAVPPGEAWVGPDESWEVLGVGRRFGYAPMGPGLVGWYAPLAGAADFRPDDVRAYLLDRFDGWPDPVPRLIAATPDDQILRAPIRSRPVDAPWGRGPVTLLGDAAHAMTPDLAQGACQTIEDAVVLAAVLAETGPTAEGLRRYEARRGPRVREVATRSAKIGQMSSRPGRLAAWMRTAMWRFLPEKVALGQMEALVGFDCLAP